MSDSNRTADHDSLILKELKSFRTEVQSSLSEITHRLTKLEAVLVPLPETIERPTLLRKPISRRHVS
jgi:hypothetical protein